mmetsp:Transcript_50632/g.107394  ORF Transcript_50632/g.107394 Transcript_50632/m.107394 type:complete len:111 (-) Transcript_50632:67-399(-)|eukprot:CAMPEP_0206436590 /NCGR_PEP_ID=MMETSP0324_2-20121206/10567_1 /ASSEMBLY_ACC=CAM_ASM_000836 /TAXON_ID=2866 /ORGANISM="Crypthecodinium cohnii, Strain Seligo" /LENGTH=110 /DNA_ID=CAMNT_0053903771 /DNA_START=103 /DNA_END=435 /DNA_ORIENTATION=+
MAALWAMGTPPGAAKPAVRTVNMGKAPEVTQQQYPGVSTKFLPHEAVIIYGQKLESERKYVDMPSTRQWFRDHRRRKREEEKLAEIYCKHRELSKSRSEAFLAAGTASMR